MPTSEWVRPTSFPLLENQVIAVDLETRDPGLLSSGPGFTRGEGEVIGVAIANEQHNWYFPVNHPQSRNFDLKITMSWLQEVINRSKRVVFANAGYDLGWMDFYGVTVPDRVPVEDVMSMAFLLDEDRESYSLNNLAKDYIGFQKNELLLRQVADAYEMANGKFDAKSDMWRIPAQYVGMYAEQDARITWDLWWKLDKLLTERELDGPRAIESDIVRICHLMTKQGVPVDLRYAEMLNDVLIAQEKKFRLKYGQDFSIWSGDNIAKVCDAEGVPYGRTATGKPSITKDFAKGTTNQKITEIFEMRQIDKLRRDFIEGGILERHVNGRIHPTFLPTAREEGGTVTGRFSCKNPNLQQVPKRSRLGKIIRKLYIAEDGCQWSNMDFNSQEPRLQVHYALLKGMKGAKEAKAYFDAGKKLYSLVTDSVNVSYDQSKAILLGLSYGMGLPTFSENVGVTIGEAKDIKEAIGDKIPFLIELPRFVNDMADRRGYIRTLGGRIRRFDDWVPVRFWDFVEAKKQCAYRSSQWYRYDILTTPVRGYQEAMEKFKQPVMRANTNKAFNALIQGSAADQTKLAMVNMWRAGILPGLPVHDEINRANCQSQAEFLLQKEIMENTFETQIAFPVDAKLGRRWG